MTWYDFFLKKISRKGNKKENDHQKIISISKRLGQRQRNNKEKTDFRLASDTVSLTAPPSYEQFYDYPYDGDDKNKNNVSEPGLSKEAIEDFNKKFDTRSHLKLAQIFLKEHELTTLVNESIVQSIPHVYNHVLDIEGHITNQKASGRCWMFAACNVMRLALMREDGATGEKSLVFKTKEHGSIAVLPDTFELSQSYLFFWDKLEKSNFFLEKVIELADKGEDLDSRLMQHMVQEPLNDGGQWDMLVNLVLKYGVVPQTVFPESIHSSNSREVRWLLTRQLRQHAATLRRVVLEEKKGVEAARRLKFEMIKEVYNILSVCLGRPPKTFKWEFYDKENNYKCIENISPTQFYTEWIQPSVHVADMVSLVHDPRHEEFSLMTVNYLNNVFGGRDVEYINVPIEVLVETAANVLLNKRPVWFGCDVGKYFHRPSGVMDPAVYVYDETFELAPYNLNKANRLRYGESMMTHAMVLTGTQIEKDDIPVRFRIENSWGDSTGDKGFEVMSLDWFKEYVFQIVVNKKYLDERTRQVLEKRKPFIELPPWDPMGALA